MNGSKAGIAIRRVEAVARCLAESSKHRTTQPQTVDLYTGAQLRVRDLALDLDVLLGDRLRCNARTQDAQMRRAHADRVSRLLR